MRPQLRSFILSGALIAAAPESGRGYMKPCLKDRSVLPGFGSKSKQESHKELEDAQLVSSVISEDQVAILGLINAERIEEARKLASRSAIPAHWSRVLAPPITSAQECASGEGLFEQLSHIRSEHLRAHSGKWVAFYNGMVVDSDVSRSVLRERVKQSIPLDRIVFMKIQ